MKRVKYLLYILVLVVFSGCEVDSNCGSINVDYVTFSLLAVDDDGELLEQEIAFDSIVSPSSQVRFSLDSLVTGFALPLNPGADNTSFYFYYNDTADTIIFNYEKISTVDSPECGIIEEFRGLDTTRQTFDSLVIVNDTLKRTINEANIHLFF